MSKKILEWNAKPKQPPPLKKNQKTKTKHTIISKENVPSRKRIIDCVILQY